MKKSSAIKRHTYGRAYNAQQSVRRMLTLKRYTVQCTLYKSSRINKETIRAVAYFERLHESPEEDANGVALSEQFHQSRSTEQAQEAEIQELLVRLRIINYHT